MDCARCHHRPAEAGSRFCRYCQKVHPWKADQRACLHPTIVRGVVWRANGTPDLQDVCQRCRQRWGGVKLAQVPGWEHLPVLADHREGAMHCERCGELATERHHWAPSALFADADEWPTAWLCVTCHTRWHATMAGIGTSPDHDRDNQEA